MILFISSYILYKKKYIIDEQYFDNMVKEIALRKEGENNA
jgi:hypothetical protein